MTEPERVQEVCADCGYTMNNIVAGTHVRWVLCEACEDRRENPGGLRMWEHYQNERAITAFVLIGLPTLLVLALLWWVALS